MKNIDYYGISNMYTQEGGITVSSRGCGCCANYENLTVEDAIERINQEILALTELKLLLQTEGIPT